MNYDNYDPYYINEGLAFNNSTFKEIKATVRAITKEVNGKEKFFTRIKDNLTKDKPSSDKINKLRSKVSKVFDVCYTSELVVKSRTRQYGNTVVYEEYYDQIFIGLKGDVLVRIDQEMTGSGFLMPKFSGTVLYPPKSDKEFTKDDFKNIINFCQECKVAGFNFSKLFRPKKIKLINEYMIHGPYELRFKDVYEKFQQKYPMYNVKVGKVLNYMIITKK